MSWASLPKDFSTWHCCVSSSNSSNTYTLVLVWKPRRPNGLVSLCTTFGTITNIFVPTNITELSTSPKMVILMLPADDLQWHWFKTLHKSSTTVTPKLPSRSASSIYSHYYAGVIAAFCFNCCRVWQETEKRYEARGILTNTVYQIGAMDNVTHKTKRCFHPDTWMSLKLNFTDHD